MKFYLPFIALLFTSLLSSAQSAVVSSGGDATGSGGSAAYSIGQVSIDYSTGTGGSIQEGVQQTFEVSQVNVHESLNHVQLSFFPNPAKDELNITMTEFENGLTATIRDSKGMTVKKIALQNTINPIEIGSWAQGIYFIEINTRKGQSSLFKLVKN